MPPYTAALRQTAEQIDLPWIDVHTRFCSGDLQELLPDGVHPARPSSADCPRRWPASCPASGPAAQRASTSRPANVRLCSPIRLGLTRRRFRTIGQAPIAWFSGMGLPATA